MTDSSLTVKWHAHNYSKLRVEKWGEHAVIFNPQSGETHQLDGFAMAALDLIQQPFTIETLSDRMYTFYEIEDREHLSTQIMNLINQFDNIGLIEPYIK